MKKLTRAQQEFADSQKKPEPQPERKPVYILPLCTCSEKPYSHNHKAAAMARWE